jgi:hypothetical protein
VVIGIGRREIPGDLVDGSILVAWRRFKFNLLGAAEPELANVTITWDYGFG